MKTSTKFRVAQLIVMLTVLTCASVGLAEPGGGLQRAREEPPTAQGAALSLQRIDDMTARLQSVADQARKAAQEASIAAEKAGSFASIAGVAAQRAVEARTSRAWYQEPAWYALATPILVFIIAVVAYRERKRASIADAERNVLLRQVEINEAFIRHQIRGPVALSLGVADDKLDTFTKKTVLLLHQLSLLRQIYEQKDLLGNVAEQSYQRWASKVLKPWIDSDPDLGNVWRQLCQGDDLYAEKFLKWLEPHIHPPAPLTSRCSRRAARERRADSGTTTSATRG